MVVVRYVAAICLSIILTIAIMDCGTLLLKVKLLLLLLLINVISTSLLHRMQKEFRR